MPWQEARSGREDETGERFCEQAEDPSQANRYVAEGVRPCFVEPHFVANALSAGPDSGQL